MRHEGRGLTAPPVGTHQLNFYLGVPRSTAYKVLARHGVNRLADFDRPTRTRTRYDREHPGELIHVDAISWNASPTRAAGGAMVEPATTAPDRATTSSTSPSTTRQYRDDSELPNCQPCRVPCLSRNRQDSTMASDDRDGDVSNHSDPIPLAEPTDNDAITGSGRWFEKGYQLVVNDPPPTNETPPAASGPPVDLPQGESQPPAPPPGEGTD